MALDKVQPLKLEDPTTGGDDVDLFPTELDPVEDYIECRGVVLANDTTRDENVIISRNSSSDLTFKDSANTTPLTLTQLFAGLRQTLSSTVTTDTTTTSTTFVTLLSMSATAIGNNYFLINASGSISCGQANILMGVRLTLDSVVLGGTQLRLPLANIGGVFSLCFRVPITSGAHTIVIQWKTASNTAQCRPVSNPDSEFASIVIQEVTI